MLNGRNIAVVPFVEPPPRLGNSATATFARVAKEPIAFSLSFVPPGTDGRPFVADPICWLRRHRRRDPRFRPPVASATFGLTKKGCTCHPLCSYPHRTFLRWIRLLRRSSGTNQAP